MKKIIVLIIIIVIGFMNIPNYNELNNIIIIDKIIIKENDVILREKYLTKEDNIIKYEYRNYYYKSKSLDEICKDNKNFYIDKAKYIYK